MRRPSLHRWGRQRRRSDQLASLAGLAPAKATTLSTHDNTDLPTSPDGAEPEQAGLEPQATPVADHDTVVVSHQLDITDDGRLAEAVETEILAPRAETFADLGVRTEIVQALAAIGIEHPFPIQAMAIPLALAGNDMIGQARTGTGKTLAFGVSLLQRIKLGVEQSEDGAIRGAKPQALVVAPTRELASQVSKDLSVAASVRHARVLTVYGGVAYEPQLDALANGVDLVVGTPGRLLDLMQRRVLDLSQVQVAVLDEADEMLDLGFLPDVERLLAATAPTRQTLLFSATMPSAIVSLARAHLRNPVNIRAESAEENHMVPATSQFVYQAHDLDKPEVVARILQAKDRDRVMIFCRTKRAAQRVSDDLAERGFAAASIHGDLNQQARERALTKFRSGGIDVLVATDVAARGIDVTGVSHVINYECPDDEKTYVHRIGRTGRAGATGVAITFVDWADTTRWKVISKALGLPFDEPQETYSTSAHLFVEQHIPEGVKGRINEPAPQAPAPSASERPRTPRKKSDRQRRRVHNGEVVRGSDAQRSETQPSEAPHSDGPATKPSQEHRSADHDGAASPDGDQPRRRRRRRRSGSGQGGSSQDGSGPGDQPAGHPAE